MSKSLAHKRVFPERNRGVLENTPAFTAYASGAEKIATTYGHIVSQLHEICGSLLARHPELSALICELYPSKTYTQEVSSGRQWEEKVRLEQFLCEHIDPILEESVSIQQRRLGILTQNTFLSLQATDPEERTVTIGALRDWLTMSPLAVVLEEYGVTVNEILYELGNFIGRGDEWLRGGAKRGATSGGDFTRYSI